MKNRLALAVLYIVLTNIFCLSFNAFAEEFKPASDRIVLTVDETKAEVFGEIKENDVPPIIRNSRTMVASRFVVENLGANVEWNAEKREVKITKDQTEIILTIDSNVAKVNGSNVAIDSPAFIENGRTYTPARIICENLGANVDWDGETKKITITMKDLQEEALNKFETVTFGRYEQDNKVNGREPVEWIILRKQKDYAIVISKYGLMPKRFHTENTYTHWNSCQLKPWLENVMFIDLFNVQEREAIINANPRIYLMSQNEAKNYFTSEYARMCKPTEYAIAQGASVDENGNCWWWLNTSSYNAIRTSVNPKGEIDTTTKYSTNSDVCVRPIVLMDLEKVKKIQEEQNN